MFASKKIETLETNWLALQGDGFWDANTDPDNHFIDDETERTLLNEQVQVGIRDRKGNIVIYHLNDDEGNYVEIHNMDEVALQQVTAGQVVQGNPNVIIATPIKRDDPILGYCKDNVTEIAYPWVGDERLKRISKVRREVSGLKADSKIKAKTKGYIRKNGKWKGGRRDISVGFFGATINTPGNGYITCTDSPKAFSQVKRKRTRYVKTKVTIPRYYGSLSQLNYYTLRDNQLYSYHKRGAVEVNIDFYDMPQ